MLVLIGCGSAFPQGNDVARQIHDKISGDFASKTIAFPHPGFQTENKDDKAARERISRKADTEKNRIAAAAKSLGDRLVTSGEDLHPATVSTQKSREFTPGSVKWKSGTVISRKTVSKKVPNLKEGNLYSKETDASDGSYSSEIIKVTKDLENDFSIRGIFGLNTPLIMTVDSTAGTVSMKAQQIFNHSVYGPLYVCPVDLNEQRYDPQGTLYGTLDEKGTLRLGAWGIFAIQGAYQGQTLALYSSSKWMPANAKITYTGPRETDNKIVESVVEQELPNLINIYNPVGNGNLISATITPSKTVKVSPQELYRAVAGYIYCYPLDLQNNKMVYDKAIKGTGTDKSIHLDPWTAALKGAGGSAYIFQTTDIEFSDPISYPAAVGGSLQGKGTKDDPYRLATPKDFQILSQNVNDGEDYQNVYFDVTADIDMKDISSTFISIGNESSFDGKVNGNGHTINNFNFNGYGFAATGLFGQLGVNAEIDDLNFKNAQVRGSGKNVGILSGINKGTIKNVHIEGELTSKGESTGSVTAQNEGRISGSSFNGTLTATGATGGLVGYNAGTIEHSFAGGTVTLNGQYSSTYHHAGGLVGISISQKEGDNKVTDSYFKGIVQDISGFGETGGLIAMASHSLVERCFNTGVVQAVLGNEESDTYTGGLIGMLSKSKVNDCFNSATVLKTTSGSLPVSEDVGGLFGYISITSVTSSAGSYLSNLSEVSGCYNAGQIVSQFDNPHRGIYGSTYPGREREVEDLVFASVYNDNQINVEDTTRYGRSTDFLTGNNLPEGFSAQSWKTGAGCYPIISSTAGSEGSDLAVASVRMAQGLSTIKLKKEATITVKGKTRFHLFDGEKLTVETTAAEITGNKLIVKDSYGNETLMISDTDGNFRMLSLQVVPDIYEGSGTENDPYIMKTVADYQNLDKGVGQFGQRHRGDYFKMAGDIDFSGSSFHGIGYRNTVNEFEGNFNGDNHFVHNLTVETASLNSSGNVVPASSVWHGAMFSLVGKQGVIRNLNIAADCKFQVYHYGAAIVGQLLGTVENCRNYANVTQYGAYAGGIAGVVRDCGLIKGCYNSGRILSKEIGAGGLAGYNIGTIAYSQNDGDARVESTSSSAKNAGGIAAYSSGSIDHCVNNANVSAPVNCGGIAGEVSIIMAAGNFTRNINTGNVILTTDGSTTGGLIGYASGSGNISGNIYDASVNVEGGVYGSGNPGAVGLYTSQLTSGKAPEGFGEEYDFTAGMYPSLSKFKDEPNGKVLRSMYMKFGEGEARNNVTKSVDLSNANGVVWTADESGKDYFSISGGKLNVVIPTGMSLGKSVITAKAGDKFVKEYTVLTLPVYLSGKGTEADPYLIRNREDFTKLSNFVHQTGMDYKGVYFRLTDNIDFAGDSIPVIAGAPTNKNEVWKFQGKLDGNRKIISNFTFNCTKAGSYGGGKSVGIVGILGEAGEIKDLITAGTINANGLAGGIAGQCYGVIRNCENRTSVSGTSDPNGGIVGKLFAGGRVTECVNKGEIYTIHTYGGGGIVGESQKGTVVDSCRNEGKIKIGAKGKSAGGIVGYGGGLISRCVNNGEFVSEAVFSTTISSQFIGGIVGRFAGTPTEITACVNEKEINVPFVASVGGIAGGNTSNRSAANTLDIHDNLNKGNITALGTVGGIVGFVPSGSQVFDNVNKGNVESVVGNTTRKLGNATSGTSMGYAGGIVGYLNSNSTTAVSRLYRCVNEGNVSCPVEYTGGIASYTATGSQTDSCINLGAVTSLSKDPSGGYNGNFISYEVGGIAGSCYGNLSNSWNAGKVTADGHDIGGIVGLQGGEISNCVNLGEVEVRPSNVNSGLSFQPTGGGVVGRGNRANTINCVNFGKVTAPDRAAGIISMLMTSGGLMSSYNAGEVRNTNASYDYLSNTANNKDAAAAALDRIFFLKDKNPHIGNNLIDNSKYAQGLSESELMSADLGDGFLYTKASLPMAKGLYNPGVPHFEAARITFEGKDNREENVCGIINIADLKDLVWTSSPNIEITGSLAVPRETGKGWIRVQTADASKERTYNLTITKAVPAIVLPTSIKLDKEAVEGDIDEVVRLTATIEPENVTDNEKTIKWSSSDEKVCSVKDGAITLLSPGEATVTATTVNNLTASCNVKVRHLLPTSIILDKHSYQAVVGEQFTLTATIDPENATDKSVIWSSSNEKVCTVTSDGKVSILSAGSTKITAHTVNGLTDTCDVTGISGVGQIYVDGKEVKTVVYYDLDGKPLNDLHIGKAVIVKYIFTDGSTRHVKRIADKNLE